MRPTIRHPAFHHEGSPSSPSLPLLNFVKFREVRVGYGNCSDEWKGAVAVRESQKSHRLTADDVELFERVADGMIRHSEWAQVTRNHDNQTDYFQVRPVGADEIAFSLGRCATGSYIFLNHRTGDVRFAGEFSALLEKVDRLQQA